MAALRLFSVFGIIGGVVVEVIINLLKIIGYLCVEVICNAKEKKGGLCLCVPLATMYFIILFV